MTPPGTRRPEKEGDARARPQPEDEHHGAWQRLGICTVKRDLDAERDGERLRERRPLRPPRPPPAMREVSESS